MRKPLPKLFLFVTISSADFRLILIGAGRQSEEGQSEELVNVDTFS